MDSTRLAFAQADRDVPGRPACVEENHEPIPLQMVLNLRPSKVVGGLGGAAPLGDLRVGYVFQT